MYDTLIGHTIISKLGSRGPSIQGLHCVCASSGKTKSMKHIILSILESPLATQQPPASIVEH